MPALRVPALRRVGHKGAALIAPGNTLASFDAALAAGVDMIEFDVLEHPVGSGRLVVAHDAADAAAREALSLEEGLDHLAGPSFAAIELDVDVKQPGYETQVVRALGERALLERSLISSHYPRSLVALRGLAPATRLGWSVPRLRQDPFRSRALALPARAALGAARAGLPARAAAAIRARHCDALMAHWRLVTPRLVGHVHAAGGELYVWTVDEPARIRALDRLGVTGVITNDPRLFAALSQP